MVSTNPARGMRDFLPPMSENAIRDRHYQRGLRILRLRAARDARRREYRSLMGKYGDRGQSAYLQDPQARHKLNEELESYRVTGLQSSESSSDSALCNSATLSTLFPILPCVYDLTVPLGLASSPITKRPPKIFQRYQKYSCLAADRPARDAFREFYQCGCGMPSAQARWLSKLKLPLRCQRDIRRLGLRISRSGSITARC